MIFLLDVNVLIALAWPEHNAHARVQTWFQQTAQAGWASCPFTQAGFVRILSNPAFSPNAVPPKEVIRLLGINTNHPGHRFWKDEITFAEAVQPFQAQFAGHQQATDAYLLGLAAHQSGKLATLDERMAALLGKNTVLDYLEFIGS